MLKCISKQTRFFFRAAIVGVTISALAMPNIVLAQDAAASRAEQRQGPIVPPFALNDLGTQFTPGLPHIVVVDAGGTLTSRARDRISYLHYQGSVQGGVQTILNDLYPELASVANVSIVHAGGLGGSSAVKNATLYYVSREIDAQLAKPDVDGVVVTVGTSVLEEDAYFFDLTVQSQKPVVVTGSMHQYGTFTYDAYTNLFSSIRLAASKKTTCFGTVVLLADQFFAARDVLKTDGFAMTTFGSRQHGALGVVNEDHIRPMRAPSRIQFCGTASWKTPFNLSQTTPDKLAQVDIAYSYVEASGATISGLVAGGAKGIVTAGEGPGDISYLQNAERKKAIDRGIVFVSATRTGGEGTYDAGTPGIIGAGDLAPQKSRLLLQMGLTYSKDPEQIRKWFNTIGAAEFDMSAQK